MTAQFTLDGHFEYPIDELKSALQKSIRRSREEDALYWAARSDVAGQIANLNRRKCDSLLQMCSAVRQTA
jgi:replication-associated recombination protein RarA